MFSVENLLEYHDQLTKRARKVMQKKNHDYTSDSGDPFANFRISSTIGVHPVKGILMRMTDKLKRIQCYVENGELHVDGEGWQDAVDDLVNYAILAGAMMQEEAESKGTHTHVEENPQWIVGGLNLEECTMTPGGTIIPRKPITYKPDEEADLNPEDWS